jgi:hypothetical protein
MKAASPELSVVLAADRLSTVRRTLRHLREQSARQQIELVLVGPSVAELTLEAADREAFWGVKVVESSLESIVQARAAAIRSADSPVVVLAETHSFPDPGWAAALIAAHRGPWAAVGPAIANANPDSLISWVNLFLDYGPWVEARTAGPVADLPGHNSSYKRALLLPYGDELETMLRSEFFLFADLRAKGHGLYLETAARTAHLNVSHPRAWLPERFIAGRLFAATRADSWSRATRVAYCSGAPLIPFVRLRRTLRHIRSSGRPRELLPQILPLLGMALVVSAAGELWGYALGAGDAARTYHEGELHRLPLVVHPERWLN